jgi:VWFA-related protein
VVTNGKDEPVPGLRKEDFQILENGQPQTIASFEEHKGIQPTQEKLPPMPPHVFTNYPTVKTADSVNVLLLDWLNTQPEDQAYVHEQTVRYLKTIPPGTRLAIFTLGSRLHMVQGFTSNSASLVATLNDKNAGTDPRKSPLLPSLRERAMDKELIDFMVMSQAAPAGIDAVKNLQADFAGSQIADRIQLTLQALQQLARYLSGIPGRKNVIWFSGSFPISIFPDAGLPRQYQGELQQTADLLTPSQVAIYPVSAQGLMPDGTYFAMYQPGEPPPVREENGRRASDQTAMEELAKDTGGQAFYNTNGLDAAMAHIVNNGSRYYTVTYTPTNKKVDGSYRSIQVKILSGKYKVAYRRGYYAENLNTAHLAPQEKKGDPLLPLMRYGMPDLSQIVYKVRVQPVDPQPAPDAARAGSNKELKAPVTRYSVDFAVFVDDLRLEVTPEGQHNGNVEVMLVAYDRNGEPLNLLITKRGISLDSKAYAASQRLGLQIHEVIDVPKTDAYICTGVYDPASSKAGTIAIPLNYETVQIAR